MHHTKNILPGYSCMTHDTNHFMLFSYSVSMGFSREVAVMISAVFLVTGSQHFFALQRIFICVSHWQRVGFSKNSILVIMVIVLHCIAECVYHIVT